MTKQADGRSSLHRTADGKGWEGWVSFGVDPNTGRRLRRHVRGKTKAACAQKIAELEGSRTAGFDGMSKDVTVGDWLQRWIEARSVNVRPKTLAGYRVDAQHIERAIGRRKLSKVTAEDVETLYRAVLAAGCSTGTVAHVRRTLSVCLNAAVDRGRLGRNPVRLAVTPRHEEKEVEPFTVDEARRILEQASRLPASARWSIALALGLRQGEVLGLRWPDVDLEARTLRVRNALARQPWQHGCATPVAACGRRAASCPARHGGGLVLGPVKSSAGHRTWSLPAELASQLATHHARQTEQRLLAGPVWRSSGFVFASPFGGPTDPRRDHRAWGELLQAAGVHSARLHDARHTAATFLLVQGVDARTVMDLMGWTSATLLHRYQHVVDELKVAAASRMSDVLWPTSIAAR